MKTYKFTINGNKYAIDVADIEDNKAMVEVNGTPYTVELDMPDLAQKVQPKVKVTPVAAKPAPVTSPSTQSTPKVNVPPAQTAKSSGSTIKSPLPGVILDVFVRVGDTVKVGQHVILLEAMKMENNIDADKEGVVKEVRIQRNDSVMEGDVLIVIE